MNQRFSLLEAAIVSSILQTSTYARLPHRVATESERRQKIIGAMIRKGRKTISAKQAFLHVTSKQKRVLYRHQPKWPVAA